jgi:hypothetical protein
LDNHFIRAGFIDRNRFEIEDQLTLRGNGGPQFKAVELGIAHGVFSASYGFELC